MFGMSETVRSDTSTADHDAHSLVFREATTADVDEAVRVINAAYSIDETNTSWVGSRDFQRGERTNHAEVAELLDENETVLLLGHLDGTLVSSCTLHRSHDSAHLGQLAVDPAAQQGGIGRRTLANAERFAASTWGTRRIELQVVNLHVELQAWYERRGYVRTGSIIDFPAEAAAVGPNAPAAWLIDMRKELTEQA